MENNDYINSYLSYIISNRDLSVNTLAIYKSHLNAFKSYLANKSILEVKPYDIDEFMTYLSSLNLSGSTRNHYLIAVHELYKFLIKKKYLIEDPCIDIDRVKQVKKVRNYLTDKDISDIRTYSSNIDIRNRTIIELLLGTGVRCSELTGLKISAIDINEGFITVYGKGAKFRNIPLLDQVKTILIEYLEYRKSLTDIKPGEEDILLLTTKNNKHRLTRVDVWNVVKKVCNAAGINKTISPHCFRHTFATTLLSKKVDLYAVSKCLGHTSINTTAIYLHSNINMLKEAVNGIKF